MQKLSDVSLDREYRRALRASSILHGSSKHEMRIRAMPLVADIKAKDDGTTLASVVANEKAFTYVSVSSVKTKSNKTDVILNCKLRFQFVVAGAPELLIDVRRTLQLFLWLFCITGLFSHS